MHHSSLFPFMGELVFRYWNDPEVLEKLSKAMGPQFGSVIADGEEEEEEEENEEIADVHDAASRGDFA